MGIHYLLTSNIHGQPLGVRPLISHDSFSCQGQHCSLHNPSDHPLSHAPAHWNSKRAAVERICEHGKLHNDPDDDAWKGRTGEPFESHVCDGCCAVNR
jgi:hypothetical protein